ncbi:hypothetical protein KP509_14G080600 [Ceratopteris richardii]|uniref:Uncharacterized protein n=1 Tax=Ceratopteris richardii TaxID=49495 RepID=A0A8T2TBL9_CERRI|nr:hypothetical protein KP509_14G080600 [Ceratopteris richardii]
MEQVLQIREHADGIFEKLRKWSPASSQIVRFFALILMIHVAFILGGPAISRISVTLLLVTPIFLFFSQIHVPIDIILFLCVASILTGDGVGVTCLYVVSWIYNHFKGQHPLSREQIDFSPCRAMEVVEGLRQKSHD